MQFVIYRCPKIIYSNKQIENVILDQKKLATINTVYKFNLLYFFNFTPIICNNN